MYTDMLAAFSRTVSQGGWLGGCEPEMSPQDQQWLRLRREANSDGAAISHTFNWYLDTTRRSMGLWRNHFTSRRFLFDGGSLNEGPVLRLYNERGVSEAAAEAHTKLGVLREAPALEVVAKSCPWLATACGNGTIQGAIFVEGYTFDIRHVVKNLLNHLEDRQVRFSWNSLCEEAILDSHDQVTGLRFSHGMEFASDYVILPGAYAEHGLLEQFKVRISGVAGRWLLIPRPPGFLNPMKSHFSMRSTAGCTRPVVDLNFTPYQDRSRNRDYLAIGGGYLHAGSFPFRYSRDELGIVDAEIERAVRLLMPEWFEKCERAGDVIRSEALCVRSFTPDDRPAVAVRQTDRGGAFILHAGLNTGTTAMAPAIAASVVDYIASDDTVHAADFGAISDHHFESRLPGYWG